MKKQFLTVRRKARYFQLGKASNNTSTVWVVLHGYGMLSEFFIKKFKKLENDNTLIIAPEGLNMFYLDGKYDRVGASWITKEEREKDIEENIDYLNSLLEVIYNQVGHSNITFNILGFSQGGATACRWIFNSKIQVKNLILWAGDIPKDTLTVENKNKWESINTHLVMGEKDTLINEKMRAKFIGLVSDYGLKYTLTKYDGDHRVYPDVLTKLAETF